MKVFVKKKVIFKDEKENILIVKLKQMIKKSYQIGFRN